MSKVLKVVAVVAAVVAIAATGGAALAGSGTFLGMSAGTLTTIAGIASAVSATASFGAQAFAKPPPAKGAINQLIVQTDAVHPYVMGRTYFGGVLRHAASYGPTINKVPNPYLSRVVVYSGAGPIDGFESFQVDYGYIGSYYNGWLSTSSQLGLCPEATALTAGWAGFPNWSSSHKLSGQAAAMWNFKFDKDGKVFASGLPQTGAVLRGVKVYDPRLDSTYPGGSGSQRITDESTWAYSANPALHAIAYAYGRYQNGKKVFGVGLPVEAIDLVSMTAWANVCDANGWTISGVAFEPSDRWDNLKNIMAAGGAEPLFSGARLSVKYHAPRVALDTITEEDLADGQIAITAMRSYRDRINTIVPKWRSEAHNWEYVPGADVAVSSYIAEDGEIKKAERQYNYVADANQAAQLATYEMLERRELGLIELQCGPRMLAFRPGECLVVDLPEEGLSAVEAVILSREIDPGTMNVRFTLIGETPAKHAFALGLTATPPPTPSLTMSHQARDNLSAELALPLGTATVTLHQRTATNTAPTVATTGSTTYTFETGEVTGQPSGWSLLVPSTGGDYLWAIQAVASSRASTATIANADWNGPRLVSQNGLDAITGFLTNEAITLAANSAGTVSSFASATGTFKVFQGVTERTTSSSFSVVSSTGCTVSINATTGVYSVSAMSADTANTTLQAIFGGVTIQKVLTLSKSRAGTNGTIGADGLSAISGYLTNEAINLFAYAEGTVVSYAPATGSFKVFSGNTDISGSFTLSTVGNPQSLTVSYSGQTYSITGGFAASADTATLTIRATGTGVYSGVTLDKVVSLSKTKGGYEIVSTLPTANLFAGRMVFLTTDNKLYRYTGTAWTAAVPATDISGTLADAQIAAVAAAKVTGQLSDTQLAAISTAKLLGQISTGQLADAAVTTAKFAASIEPITTVASVPAAKSTSTVFNSTDGKLYRWNGTAYVATVASGDISGTIADSQLAAISAAKVTGTLSDSQIASIAAAKLTGQIVTTQITDGAISTTKIAAGAVTASQIAADTITAGNIAANAITSTELAAGAVVAGKIAAGTIQAADIAAGTITGDRLAAATITASQIATDTITAGQIAAGAITASELAANSVIAGKIAAGSITSADIAADTITAGNIAANAITSSELAAGAIVAGKIAAGTIQAADIAAGAITAGKIAANAVTATELAANAVTADKINAGAVTAAKMSVNQLSAITATIGTLRTATTGARTEISDNVIKVFDGSGVLRVKIGNLAL